MTDQEKKRAIAKLYNLKSYIDGKIQEVNANMLTLDALANGIGMMAANCVKEILPVPDEVS